MVDLSIRGRPAFQAKALLIGERIDLRSLESTERFGGGQVTIAVRGGGVAVLFRYGAVVLFDTAPMEQASFLAQLEPLVTQRYAVPEVEVVELRVDPAASDGMEGDTIVLADGDAQRLALVADILAKSVVLARYEAQINETFDRIEPLAVDLMNKGRTGPHAKELLKHIGGALLSQQKMIGRVEMTDKPDLLWERADLERLYSRLEQVFELRERHTALERKLDLIEQTAKTALELVQNRHSIRVEWYIVALIVFEILLTLYDLFVRVK